MGLGLENSGAGACAGELGRPGYQGELRGGGGARAASGVPASLVRVRVKVRVRVRVS